MVIDVVLNPAIKAIKIANSSSKTRTRRTGTLSSSSSIAPIHDAPYPHSKCSQSISDWLLSPSSDVISVSMTTRMHPHEITNVFAIDVRLWCLKLLFIFVLKFFNVWTAVAIELWYFEGRDFCCMRYRRNLFARDIQLQPSGQLSLILVSFPMTISKFKIYFCLFLNTQFWVSKIFDTTLILHKNIDFPTNSPSAHVGYDFR